MIRRYCDICEQQIGRNYVSERFRPSLYLARRNWAAEVIVCKGGTWNQGDICLDCLKQILNEGAEYRTTPHYSGAHA